MGDCAYSQDLGGAWLATSSNGSVVVPAVVPGQIHLDLYRAGVIGDPYATNESSHTAWVREDSWAFTRDVPVGAGAAACGRLLLVAEGLDTLAAVTLDGSPAVAPKYTRTPNMLPTDRLNFTRTLNPPQSDLIPTCVQACERDPLCVGFTTSNTPMGEASCWL